MTTAAESAGTLWAALRQHLRPCDHTAEVAALLAIRDHIEADRHEQRVALSHGASNFTSPAPAGQTSTGDVPTGATHDAG